MNTSPAFFEKDHSSIGIDPSQKSRQPRIKITRYWPDMDHIWTRYGPDIDNILTINGPDIDQIWTIYGSYIWDWIIPTHPNLCDFHQKKSNPSVLVGVSHPSLSRGRRSGNAEGCALKWWEKTWGFLWGETVEFKQKTWKDMERSWLVGGAISP